MEDEWETTKRELVSYFSQNDMSWSGAGRVDGVGGWGQTSMNAMTSESRRAPSALGGVGGDVSESMKRKMLEYARRVLDLNERRKGGKPYPLAFRFGQASSAVASSGGDSSQKGVKNCWDLLQSIMSEEVSPSGDVKTSEEPTQEAEYERSKGSATDVRVLKHWLQGSRQFLEEQYYTYIENFVRTQRKDVAIGSLPGRENVIQGFVYALLHGKPHWERCEKPDGVNPIWAQIYYAMRSGQLEAAEKFAKALGDKTHFFKWYGHYRNDPNHVLPADLSIQVMAEYRRLSTQDPYKQLVYNLVGQCDPMRSHDDIYKFATEDYMWFKLNMVTVDDPSAGNNFSSGLLGAVGSSATSASFGMPTNMSNASATFTLSQFQALITEYGPEHFSNPIVYFQILLLSLQFESAIHFLESTGQYPVETLHFALTLYYYGALNVPEAPLTAPLMGYQHRSAPGLGNASVSASSASSASMGAGHMGVGFIGAGAGALQSSLGNPFWNIVRHVTQYIRNFDNSNILAALNYIYLLRNPDVRNLCLRDLLTDTQEFALLLGSVNADGTRQPGYLEKFISQADWREVVSLAAVAYEQAGKYDDAISLFDAAMYYEKVVDLITKQLSRILTSSGAERQRIVDYARARYDKYEREPTSGHLIDMRGDKAWLASLTSFRTLLLLCNFFDLYHASQYHEALDVIADLGLLPFDHSQIESCSANFKNLADPVRRNFAEIILATMTCLYRMFVILKDEGLNAERESFLRSLKAKARALVTFTGLINFRMPADTQSRLVRMEASMT